MNRVTIARRLYSTTLSSSLPASHTASTKIPLSNIESQWEKLEYGERAAVREDIGALNKKDWKELTIEEKKAAYYVAFGPHGPRAPVSKPGDNLKVALGVAALLSTSVAVFFGFKSIGGPVPRTVNKEWQEASSELALKQKANPISGISSDGYKGKGFVQSK
ncbi:cytochrome c oxidase subunit IV [Cylindrobasidium torrendii FP15055 ss-10]|uniref:Cytochrome c oxidase subunit IV n=1 Tax=Cylindrobasidium torrendii FP15055 ss-10 TaxID=1314674 RepID=A0A0D7BDE9_9AGAR|nr:cytochrome c oxidase subunit IV [Cylindrobasidium torrendii FP15055 ss-10]